MHKKSVNIVPSVTITRPYGTNLQKRNHRKNHGVSLCPLCNTINTNMSSKGKAENGPLATNGDGKQSESATAPQDVRYGGDSKKEPKEESVIGHNSTSLEKV